MLNDLRSLDLDVVAINETRISNVRPLGPIFDDYEIFSSCGLSEVGCGEAGLFHTSLNLEVKAIFLDLGGKLVLDVTGSEGSVLRLVVVSAPT